MKLIEVLCNHHAFRVVPGAGADAVAGGNAAFALNLGAQIRGLCPAGDASSLSE
jgi:hypothetical protein